jgi:hypothetical protein
MMHESSSVRLTWSFGRDLGLIRGFRPRHQVGHFGLQLLLDFARVRRYVAIVSWSGCSFADEFGRSFRLSPR